MQAGRHHHAWPALYGAYEVAGRGRGLGTTPSGTKPRCVRVGSSPPGTRRTGTAAGPDDADGATVTTAGDQAL